MKYLLALILSLVIAVGALGFLYKREVQSATALAEQNKALIEAEEHANMRREKDRSTLVAREKDRRSQGLKLAQAEQALSEALQRNKTWSDTNVPTEIQSRILGLSGGLAGDFTGVSDSASATSGN